MSFMNTLRNKKNEVAAVITSSTDVAEGMIGVAYAGMAWDRKAKLMTVAGMAAIVTGTVIGAKVITIGGIGCVLSGFVEGFRKAMNTEPPGLSEMVMPVSTQTEFTFKENNQ